MVQLYHSFFQLTCLVGCKAEVAYIVRAMFLRLVVSQFSLDSVGAQKGMGDKWAGQTTRQDVIPQLQAQVVPTEMQEVKAEMLQTSRAKILEEAVALVSHTAPFI